MSEEEVDPEELTFPILSTILLIGICALIGCIYIYLLVTKTNDTTSSIDLISYVYSTHTTSKEIEDVNRDNPITTIKTKV